MLASSEPSHGLLAGPGSDIEERHLLRALAPVEEEPDCLIDPYGGSPCRGHPDTEAQACGLLDDDEE
eukprot:11085303-Heterocapsa_arctica.AAC.1